MTLPEPSYRGVQMDWTPRCFTDQSSLDFAHVRSRGITGLILERNTQV